MPYKDPEAKRAWRAKNREKNAEYLKGWKAENGDRIERHIERQKIANRVTSLFRENIEKAVAAKGKPKNKHIAYNQRIRNKVLDFLGGRCEWCGLDERLCLEVDHIEPINRRTNSIPNWSSQTFYRSVLRGETTDVQLLCSNCHTIKTRLGDEFTGGNEAPPFDPLETFSRSGD